MDKSGGNKAKLSLKTYAATFIDILGQGAALRKLKDSEWWKLTPETKKLLSETYGRVLRFRHLYESYLEGAFRTSKLEQGFMATGPTEGDVTLWHATKPNELQVLCIADSIIALVPLQIQNGIFPFPTVFALMGACGGAMLTSFCEHRAIRGGIAFGPCIFNGKTKEVYGSAISTAVELEKLANWPRILVDPEIVRVAKIFANYRGSGKAEQLNSSFASICLNLVANDVDDRPFLDYLGRGAQESLKIPEDMFSKAESNILSLITEHAGNTKVQDKYKMAYQYFAKNKRP